MQICVKGVFAFFVDSAKVQPPTSTSGLWSAADYHYSVMASGGGAPVVIKWV